MNLQQKRQVAIVLMCHFTAAFSALGMPPFFGLILSNSLGIDSTYLVGWFYIVPTICTALAAPWWGAMADRWGKKLSLLRAQFGLALGFLLAGWATDSWFFLLALVVQGALGGTMAASNAYLATIVQGENLARCLTLMQGSARAAMVTAPLLFGFVVSQTTPIEMYRYLVLLPLVAALLLYLVPELPVGLNRGAGKVAGNRASLKDRSIETNAKLATMSTSDVSLTALYGLKFSFAFVTVITFPYFVPFAQQAIEPLSLGGAGFLFSLPHLVYLLSASMITRWSQPISALQGLAWGFGLLMVSLVTQALSTSLISMVIWRLVMGGAMTLCFVMLHRLMSQVISSKRAGRDFASLDSAAKWAGVAAGLIAGVVTQFFGLTSPFWGAAAVSLISVTYLYGASLKPISSSV